MLLCSLYVMLQKTINACLCIGWHSGTTGSALDLQSTGRGFISYSGLKLCIKLGQVVHTCTYVTNQYNLVPVKGWWCSAAGKVTAGLAKSNGSLLPGGWLIVTCGLTACTMLSNEYGKPLPFQCCEECFVFCSYLSLTVRTVGRLRQCLSVLLLVHRHQVLLVHQLSYRRHSHQHHSRHYQMCLHSLA